MTDLGTAGREALDRLLELCRRRGLDPDAVDSAAKFAARAHDGQYRKSGEPYVTHPIEVAHLVADLHGSVEMVIAALLHDTIEDTDVTEVQLERRFGAEVTRLVLGCTKTARVRAEGGEESLQAERLRTLFVALASDPRVVVIKLADRLHNLRTISALPEAKARRIARETLTIHSPLAHRLGLGSLKAELEDRAFAVADPDGYHQVEKALAEHGDLHAELVFARDRLAAHLLELGIEATISGRIKHRWSLYRKAIRYGLPPEHLHDLLGLRVVVSDRETCYDVLTALRLLWPLEEDRTKDYIVTPKPNGYRSVHCVAVIAGTTRVEIQIRTEEMHRAAEFGPAAHWSYKTDAAAEAPWLRRLLDWHHESASASDYLEGIHRELGARSDLLLLTPGGDVVNLPDGASVVDFAYAVHTAIGDRAIGARVDGRQTGLDTRLRHGQTVEILTGRRPGPSLDWLEHAVTSKARLSIRRHHERKRRRELREHGAALFERACRDAGLTRPEPIPATLLEGVGCRNTDELFDKVATGRVTLTQLRRVINRPSHPVDDTAPPKASVLEPLVVRPRDEQLEIAAVGLPGVRVRMARCCAPHPGTPLLGVVHAGVVAAHSRGCANAARSTTADPGREVECHWVRNGTLLERLEVTVQDRPGILADLAAQVQSAGAELRRATLHGSAVTLIVVVTPNRSPALRSALRLGAGVGAVRLV